MQNHAQEAKTILGTERLHTHFLKTGPKNIFTILAASSLALKRFGFHELQGKYIVLSLFNASQKALKSDYLKFRNKGVKNIYFSQKFACQYIRYLNTFKFKISKQGLYPYLTPKEVTKYFPTVNQQTVAKDLSTKTPAEIHEMRVEWEIYKNEFENFLKNPPQSKFDVEDYSQVKSMYDEIVQVSSLLESPLAHRYPRDRLF